MPEFTLDDAMKFLLEEGDAFIEDKVKRYGALRLPHGCDEAEQCTAILNTLKDYAKRTDPPRPFSIAVFGPPGSGKSFTVKQLAKAAGDFGPPEEINLSQIGNPEELTKRMAEILDPEAGNATRLIFFDEFDCALNGKSLGWLRWFLAPMQDGVFLYSGKAFPVGQAVFVFAGGTADCYQDFKDRHREYFVKVKGPDFVSRLRGILDIEGLNTPSDYRILRRSLVLQHLLGKRSEGLKSQDGTLKIDKGLLRSLLAVGRYKHGARSLEALLDMCTLTGAPRFEPDSLPPVRLRPLHVDRGPMATLTVGISAGGEADYKFHKKLATALLERGATLAYSGDLRKEEENGILDAMIEVEQERPSDLVPPPRKCIQSFLADPIFKKSGIEDHLEKYEDSVDFHRMETLREDELASLNLPPFEWFSAREKPYKPKNQLAWALSLFRMRLTLVQEIDALVVAAGKTTGSSGRFPGIAEEVMLALAFNVPVYIIGMSKGAAWAVGNLMGLSWIYHGIPDCLLEESHRETHPDYDGFKKKLEEWSAKFDVAYKSDLPTTYDGLRQFLVERAPGKPGWPDNGLTVRENRDLFNADKAKRCIELVTRGLLRLEWKK